MFTRKTKSQQEGVNFNSTRFSIANRADMAKIKKLRFKKGGTEEKNEDKYKNKQNKKQAKKSETRITPEKTKKQAEKYIEKPNKKKIKSDKNWEGGNLEKYRERKVKNDFPKLDSESTKSRSARENKERRKIATKGTFNRRDF